jgi:lipopolysaccharide export system protein LptA
MKFNTKSEIVYFLAPTTIWQDENLVYCEQGWYDTQNDISQFSKNAWIKTGEQIVKGDTIFYDQQLDFGQLYGNIEMIDTVQNAILKGEYAEYDKLRNYAMVTDSALAILIEDQDSLFLHADTLYTTFDSTQSAEYLYAYRKTKFYREDIQGMCDSLFYNFIDSLIILYKDPVLWSEDNQLTADSIFIEIKNEEIDKMILHNTSFIISRDDSTTFNQIKGINMTGYFSDNKLARIIVEANSETIYFVREEDKSLIGINKVVSGNMRIDLVDNEIERITYIENPIATLYPENEIIPEELLLKGFTWKEDRRPKSKLEIFYW